MLVLCTSACTLGAPAEEEGLKESNFMADDLFTLKHEYSDFSLAGPDEGRVVSASTNIPAIRGAYISEGRWTTNIAEAERQLATLGTLGVNTVIDYQLALPDNLTSTGPGTTWRRYMDAARTAKVKIIYPLPGYLVGLKPTDGTNPAQFTKIRTIIQTLRKEPQIGGWYVHDEKLPSTTIGKTIDLTKNYVISIEQMQALYNLIKTEDSLASGGLARPQYSVWVSLPTYTQYKARYTKEYRPYGDPNWLATETAYNNMMRQLVQNCTDTVMVDNYPFGNPGVPAGTPLDEYPRIALTRAKSLLKTGQPLIFVFQSFSWKVHNPTGAPNATYPTLAHMRTMIGPARQLGCNGAIAYNWYDLDNPPAARDLPGRAQCFTDLKTLLKQLGTTGWP